MIHVCMFCGGGPLTSEHVFARWLRDRIAADIKQVNVFDAEGLPLWSMGSFDIEANVVCEKCNSGWMSRLESACNPLLGDSMLYGSALQLNEQQQRTVSMWAVKTAMVLEAHRRRDPFKYLSASHAAWMPDHSSPPSGTTVRMFARPAGEGEFVITRSVGILPRHPKGEPKERIDDSKAYVSTFVVGFMGFQVFGVHGFKNDLPPGLGLTPWLQEHTIRLWPTIGGAIRWPPPRLMTLADILVFGDVGGPVE
jgi:hypothetical protein